VPVDLSGEVPELADDGVAQTAAYLRMLLLRPGEPRSRWERCAAAAGSAEIDAQAVATVLAAVPAGRPTEWPGRPGGPAGWIGGVGRPADLIDTVRRALAGTAIEPGTVDRFAAAFDLDGRDVARLHDLLRGSDAVRVITGAVQPAVGLYRGGPPRHETLSLHELHVLGPDGSPAEHQTIQVIRSSADGLESYPYRFDTDELAVEVIRGGRVGDRIYHLDADVHAVDIVLDEPLADGETTLTQVRTTFFYRVPPVPEFRRGVMRRTNDVTIWVRFHRDRVPATVWLAYWDAIDHARVLERRPVELDDDLAVHHRFGAVERAIVGFYWEWT
jgi:hypothetical protein